MEVVARSSCRISESALELRNMLSWRHPLGFLIHQEWPHINWDWCWIHLCLRPVLKKYLHMTMRNGICNHIFLNTQCVMLLCVYHTVQYKNASMQCNKCSGAQSWQFCALMIWTTAMLSYRISRCLWHHPCPQDYRQQFFNCYVFAVPGGIACTLYPFFLPWFPTMLQKHLWIRSHLSSNWHHGCPWNCAHSSIRGIWSITVGLLWTLAFIHARTSDGFY